MNAAFRSLGISLVAIGTVLMLLAPVERFDWPLPSTGSMVGAATVAAVTCSLLGYLKAADRSLIVISLGVASVVATWSAGAADSLFIAGGLILASGYSILAGAEPRMAALLGAAALTGAPLMTIAPVWISGAGIALSLGTLAGSFVHTSTNALLHVNAQPPSDTEPDAPDETERSLAPADYVTPTDAEEARQDSSPPVDSSDDEAAYVVIGSGQSAPSWSRAQDHPPPRGFVEPRPGHWYDGYVSQNYVVRCASHVGYRHMVSETTSDDSYSVVASPDGKELHVIVADGVGSVSHGGIAATTICKLIASGLDDGQPIDDIFGHINQTLVNVLRDEHGDVEEDQFATTLVVASFDLENSLVEVRRIGDSTAFHWNGEEVSALFEVDDTMQGTDALPRTDPVVQIVSCELEDREAVIVCTDGVAEHLYFSMETRMIFEAAMSDIPSALDFCRLVGFEARQAHDDQTAVAIWKRV